MAMVSDVAGFGGSGIGGRDDWMKNVLGQEILGHKLTGFVSTAEGVSRAVVRLPSFTEAGSLSQLASIFRVASGVAARGGYTVMNTAVDDMWQDHSSDEETPRAVEGNPFGFSRAGVIMNAINTAVSKRCEQQGEERFANSGECYECLMKPEAVSVSTVKFKQLPRLGELVECPESWLRPSDELALIGVSLRDSVIHFQKGWGQGNLNARDFLMVVKRMKYYSQADHASLFEMRVGGRGSDPGPSCRQNFAKLLGLEELHVWGSSTTYFKVTPDWDLMVRKIASEGLDPAVPICGQCSTRELLGTVDDLLAGVRVVTCGCWRKPPCSDDKYFCKTCQLYVVKDSHENHCRITMFQRDRNSVLGSAWVGDALHQLDVRSHLLNQMSHSDAVKVLENYVSAKAQETYLLQRMKLKFSTTLQASEWFESNYNSFRTEYVRWMASEQFPEVLQLVTGDAVAKKVESIDQVQLPVRKKSVCTCVGSRVSALEKAVCMEHGGVEPLKLYMRGKSASQLCAELELVTSVMNVGKHAADNIALGMVEPKYGDKVGDGAFQNFMRAVFKGEGSFRHKLAVVLKGRKVASYGMKSFIHEFRKLLEGEGGYDEVGGIANLSVK